MSDTNRMLLLHDAVSDKLIYVDAEQIICVRRIDPSPTLKLPERTFVERRGYRGLDVREQPEDIAAMTQWTIVDDKSVTCRNQNTSTGS